MLSGWAWPTAADDRGEPEALAGPPDPVAATIRPPATIVASRAPTARARTGMVSSFGVEFGMTEAAEGTSTPPCRRGIPNRFMTAGPAPGRPRGAPAAVI